MFVSSWFFHPLTGIMLAIGVLIGIYYASQYRVQFLTQAGELTGSEYHVYVPIVLYGLEIFLGIPTYFMVLWLHSWLRVRQHRRKFTQLRDFEVVLRNTALRKYNEYTVSLEQYNEWSRHNNR